MKRLRSLLDDRAARRDAGMFVAEGIRLIEGILDRNGDIRTLYIAVDAHDAERADALFERADAAGIAVFELEAGISDRISATVTPQSVFAEVALPEHELLDVADGPVLMLVGIQDPGNAGTMLRSAEAAGCRGVIFAGNSVDPWNSKAVRASAGAVCGVAIVEEQDPVKVLEVLGEAGATRVATVARGGLAPDATDLSGSVVLVVGSEAHGLADDVVAACDVAVTIPMHGAVESLNAGMAATVLAFEAARQRGWNA